MFLSNKKEISALVLLMTFFVLGFLPTVASANALPALSQISGANGAEYDVTAGGTYTITQYGQCEVFKNNGSLDLFVPANSSTEWNDVISSPGNGISVSSCVMGCTNSSANNYNPSATTDNGSCSYCVSDSGQSCTSSANSCGQTSSGTYSCSGVCSASTPSNPSYYGQSCSSSANSCGQTNSGTYNCSDQCSASTPSNPSYYGQSCSASNACGTNSGTYDCNDNCSASAPTIPSNYGQQCNLNSCGVAGGTIQCNGSCSGSTPANPGSCTSSANSCGQTGSGTYSCSGVCSASTPSNPSYYGQSCSSPANACGQTSSGTYDCSDNCSATVAPSYSGSDSLYGQSCTSPANACGQTLSGTYGCNNQCSQSSAPSNNSCTPGCTDPSAVNYNSSANLNDGSCEYHKCFDISYNEWNVGYYDGGSDACGGLYSPDNSGSLHAQCDKYGNSCSDGGWSISTYSGVGVCADVGGYGGDNYVYPGQNTMQIISSSGLYDCY